MKRFPISLACLGCLQGQSEVEKEGFQKNLVRHDVSLEFGGKRDSTSPVRKLLLLIP